MDVSPPSEMLLTPAYQTQLHKCVTTHHPIYPWPSSKIAHSQTISWNMFVVSDWQQKEHSFPSRHFWYTREDGFVWEMHRFDIYSTLKWKRDDIDDPPDFSGVNKYWDILIVINLFDSNNVYSTKDHWHSQPPLLLNVNMWESNVKFITSVWVLCGVNQLGIFSSWCEPSGDLVLCLSSSTSSLVGKWCRGD